MRDMQFCGAISFTLCVISLIGIFIQSETVATGAFGLSLVSMLASLLLSLAEIHWSVGALHIHLNDLSDMPGNQEIKN